MARHAKSLYLNDADMLKAVIADNERLIDLLTEIAMQQGSFNLNPETLKKLVAELEK